VNERRRARAIARQDRGYPAGWNVRSIDDDEWMSQFDAADALGVSHLRLAFMIGARRIEPTHNSQNQAGVAAHSVRQERERRDATGFVGKSATAFADLSTSAVGLPRPYHPRRKPS